MGGLSAFGDRSSQSSDASSAVGFTRRWPLVRGHSCGISVGSHVSENDVHSSAKAIPTTARMRAWAHPMEGTRDQAASSPPRRNWRGRRERRHFRERKEENANRATRIRGPARRAIAPRLEVLETSSGGRNRGHFRGRKRREKQRERCEECFAGATIIWLDPQSSDSKRRARVRADCRGRGGRSRYWAYEDVRLVWDRW